MTTRRSSTRHLVAASDAPVSRLRTTDIIRQLRTLTRQVKMLKARIDAERQAEYRRQSLRTPSKRRTR